MNIEYFREHLKNELHKRNITLAALSVQSDLSEDTLRSVIYGKSQDLKLSTIVKIANVLDCTIDELIDRSIYSTDEKKAVNRIHGLPNNTIKTINVFLDMEEATFTKPSNKKTDTIPVFCPVGNMRDGMFYDNNLSEFLDISDYPDMIKQYADFGIRIISKNFIPTYYPNDIILFTHNRLPQYDDIVFFINQDSRMFIRRFTENGLIPLNGFGERMPIPNGTDFSPIGVAIKIVKEFDIEQFR